MSFYEDLSKDCKKGREHLHAFEKSCGAVVVALRQQIVATLGWPESSIVPVKFTDQDGGHERSFRVTDEGQFRFGFRLNSPAEWYVDFLLSVRVDGEQFSIGVEPDQWIPVLPSVPQSFVMVLNYIRDAMREQTDKHYHARLTGFRTAP